MTDPIADPERALVLAYAPSPARPALAALWRLDERLGQIVATTREAGIGAIRLAWWREALAALDRGIVPAEPLLVEAAAALVARGISGAALGEIVDGWEALLDPDLSGERLAQHGDQRGGALFGLAARALDGPGDDRVAMAGAGWALTDLAFHLSDRGLAERVLAPARERFDRLPRARWPASLRPLAMLAGLARHDARIGLARPRRPGSAGRVARAIGLAITRR